MRLYKEVEGRNRQNFIKVIRQISSFVHEDTYLKINQSISVTSTLTI